MKIILSLLLVVVTIGSTAASQVAVGGADKGWTTGLQYNPINLTIDDSLVNIQLALLK